MRHIVALQLLRQLVQLADDTMRLLAPDGSFAMPVHDASILRRRLHFLEEPLEALGFVAVYVSVVCLFLFPERWLKTHLKGEHLFS